MLKSRLLHATALVGTVLLAAPAFAQTTSPEPSTQTPSDDTTASDDTSGQEVVVTGSRIRRPNLESTVPITTVTGESFFQRSSTSVGDALNELPQLRSTFAQQNPGLGIGIAGLNLLDLRGLGTQRTLVLVNGRRHVPADILNNAVSPDINSIPNDLIERVDIVTGGSSAVYGSDAIAGVVNFVLRRSFDGVQVRGQTGINEQGYGGNQYISAMAGKNFADGKGNITVHGEYSRQERIFASDVKDFRQNNNFVTIDADTAGLTGGSDGVPDSLFFRDIRGTTIHYNGLVTIAQRSNPGAACGNATLANVGAPNTNGAAFNCNYFFSDQGRLVAQTGTRVGTSVTGSFIGGNGQTGREGKTVSVLPFNERYNFNVLGHYEFTPEIEGFVEAKWLRVNALGNNAGPSFLQNQSLSDTRDLIRLDNPFLNPADRTFLANAFLASGCNQTSVNAGCAAAGNLTAAQQAQIAAGTYRFSVARNLLDVGLRDEAFKRDTYRVVTGVRGTVNNIFSYELSANYGKYRETIIGDGYLDRQRWALSIDAGLNPATGRIQCRSQFDPAAAVALNRGGATPAEQARVFAANQARLAADIAACVPYNPFGSTYDNSGAKNYFSRTFASHAGLEQFIVSGFVSGDTSQLFELPAGAPRFAIGAEHRSEKAFYRQDPFVINGFTNAVSIGAFEPNTFKVSEAFGELQIPVLKDTLFFEELTLSGAARVAKYQGNAGRVWSYNAGVDWAPIRDLRFRGNYSRAVRAPNVSETAFPLVPNFAAMLDPCDPSRRNNGTTRLANCTADLGALLGNLQDRSYSLGVVSGSNPNLSTEKSDSWTFGGVFQPRFIPGLSLTVDYYNIKVKDVIVSLGAQAIVNACYDSPTLNNVFCPQFQRFRGPGVGASQEQPGHILFNSLIQAPLNFASRKRRGIDTNFAYRRNFGEIKFDTNVIYTHVLQNSNYQDPTIPDFETRVLGQLGDPKDEVLWDVNVGAKGYTFGYRMRYIGPQWINTYNSLFEINGIPATNTDGFDRDTYKAVFYHDIRLDIDVAKDQNGQSLKFYVGVDNVLDKGVPEGATTATGAGSAIYRYNGRSYYAGFRANF